MYHWVHLEIASELRKPKNCPWKFTSRSSQDPKYLQERIYLEAVHFGVIVLEEATSFASVFQSNKN